MTGFDDLRRAGIAATALLALVGCGKPTAPLAPKPLTPLAPLAEAPAPLPAATTTTAVAAPAAVTVVAEPAVAAEAAPHVSVDMRSGPKLSDGMPSAGEPASFRVTLRSADGQFITRLDPLLGGSLLCVIARADLGWQTVLRADELSDKNRGTHDFRTVFPLPGIYRAWFIYRYHDTTYTEELAFSVQGKPWSGRELPELDTLWQEGNGLEARLKIEPQAPKTCEPFLLATAWTRKQRPLRMTAEPDQPTTWYVAIEGGLGEIVTSTTEPQLTDPPAGTTETLATKLGGDLGTVATLRVSRPGRYRVLAVATPPGGKPGQKDATVIGAFAMTVTGEAHLNGCGK